MRLSTRLLISLLPAVIVIMAGYGSWALWQRAAISAEQARAETRAYAIAVGVAFEHAFRDLDFDDVQLILDEVSRQPRIFGLLVYDTTGSVTIVSSGLGSGEPLPSARLGALIAAPSPIELERELDGERVFSVSSPIRAGPEGQVTAVLEVLQPLSLVEEEQAGILQRFLLNTLTLLAALVILTVWLLRQLVDRPLERFVEAIRSVGGGDLSRRVTASSGVRELDAVGHEFNRMAGTLQAARDALLSETEERTALEIRLKEQEKLASLGTLAAGVAHQISAPLNVIEGRAQLLMRRRPGPEKLEADLHTIAEQADRIERIVRGLLDFARQPEPRVRPVDLVPLIRGAVRRFDEDLREARVQVEIKGPSALEARTDPDLLEEVMMILLSNSLEALREVGGGRIEIRVSHGDSDAVVEVADSGPGIDDTHAARIFEAFFTTKPGGTGLGLAVARAIVEKLGGTIGARSGPGAVLWFRVPLTKVEADG